MTKEAKMCGSVWDRGRNHKCGLSEGHKGLHEKRLADGRKIAWRLDWNETAIAKRERAAKVRP